MGLKVLVADLLNIKGDLSKDLRKFDDNPLLDRFEHLKNHLGIISAQLGQLICRKGQQAVGTLKNFINEVEKK